MTVYPLYPPCAPWLYTPPNWIPPTGANPPASLDSVYETVDQLGAVQIDTLQMVARAHYVTLWSRLETYRPIPVRHDWPIDQEQRRLFEGWYHAACFVPIHEYRYQLPQQRTPARERSSLVSPNGSPSPATAN